MTNPTLAPDARDRGYHWFRDDADSKTVSELTHQLNQAGPGARLEVHQRDGSMWLHVVPAGLSGDAARAAGFEPLNKSHLCPPDCP